MKKFELNKEHIFAYFDTETHYIHIKFSGTLTTNDTTVMYTWLYDVAQDEGAKNLYAAILDFSEVDGFEPRVLHRTAKESRKFNETVDSSHMPIALIIRTMYQEQIVDLTTKFHVDQPRRKSVLSMDEAIAFIKAWRKTNIQNEND